MKRTRLQTAACFFLCTLFISGCASNLDVDLYKEQTGIVSSSEASELALDFASRNFTPPDRNINTIKEKFADFDNRQRDCVKLENKYQRDWEIYLDIAKASLRAGATYMSYLSEVEFSRGNFKKSIDSMLIVHKNIKPPSQYSHSLSRKAYSREYLPYAITASALGQMYSRIGAKEDAINWLEDALNYWRKTKSAGANLQSPGVVYSVLAELAALQGNLLAEEYYLREGIPDIWHARVGPYVDLHAPSLNAEYAISRLAKNLMMQNRPVEAELILQKYLLEPYDTLSLQGDNVPLMANALAESLYLQGRLEDAEYASRLSLSMHRNICSPIDTIPRTETIRTLSKILFSQQNWAALNELNAQLQNEFRSLPGRYYQLHTGNPDLLLAQALAGDSDKAALVQTARLARESTGQNFDSDSKEMLEILAASAVVWHLTGEIPEALEAYQASIEKLHLSSNFSAASIERYQLFRDFYIDMLSSQEGERAARAVGIDPIETAFKLANSYNLGSVQRNLSVSALKANVKDEALKANLELLKEVELKTSALFNQLLYLKAGKQVDRNIAGSLDEEYRSLNVSKLNLEEKIRSQFPDYSRLLNPTSPSVGDIQESLASGEVFITYYFGATNSYVWSLSKDKNLTLNRINIGAKQLAEKIATLRKAFTSDNSSLSGIKPFDIKLANELYELLLADVSATHKTLDKLIVVPDGNLGSLPLGVLVTSKNDFDNLTNITTTSYAITDRGFKKYRSERFDQNSSQTQTILFENYKDVPWLINKSSISVVPSASTLVLLRQMENNGNSTMNGFVGIGDPLFRLGQEDANNHLAILQNKGNIGLRSSSASLGFRKLPIIPANVSADLSVLPPLPETRDEVSTIASMVGADFQNDLFLGSKATEENIKMVNYADKNILVFATHGLLPGELDGLDQPALALSNPQLDQSEGDGLLKMNEVLSLNLNADWVVLSACNTGGGEGAGADAFSGLGQAFFYAGARSLLLSNWAVETVSARLLTTGIFEAVVRDPSLSKSQSLRASIKSLMNRTDETNQYSYAHPIFWAPFTLVGDGG